MKVFFAKTADQFRGFMAVELYSGKMTVFNMLHDVRIGIIDKNTHSLYPFRHRSANFPGPVLGKMSRTFRVKNTSNGIDTEFPTSYSVFDPG